MELHWRDTETVQLVTGYTLEDADGTHVTTLKGARVACEGGFMHVAVPGAPIVQILSAPAVRRIAYREQDA
jgi:hypothetical protein